MNLRRIILFTKENLPLDSKLSVYLNDLKSKSSKDNDFLWVNVHNLASCLRLASIFRQKFAMQMLVLVDVELKSELEPNSDFVFISLTDIEDIQYQFQNFNLISNLGAKSSDSLDSDLELLRVKQELSAANTKVDFLTDQNTQLNHRLTFALADAEKMANQISELTEGAGTDKTLVPEETDAYKQLLSEKESISVQLVEATQRLHEIESQCADAEKVSELQSEVDKLKAQLETCSDYAELSERCKVLELEKESSVSFVEFEALKSDCEQLRGKLDAQSDYDTLKSDFEIFKSEHTDCVSKEVFDKLQSDFDDFKGEHTNCTSMEGYTALQEEFETFKSEHSDCVSKSDFDELQAKFDALNASVSETVSVAEFNEIKCQLDNSVSREVFEKLQNDFADLSATNDSLVSQEDYAELFKKCAALESAALGSVSKEQYEEIKSKLEGQSDYEEIKAKLESQSDYAEIKSKLDSQSDYESVKQQLAEQSDYAVIKEKLNSVSNYDELKAQVDSFSDYEEIKCKLAEQSDYADIKSKLKLQSDYEEIKKQSEKIPVLESQIEQLNFQLTSSDTESKKALADVTASFTALKEQTADYDSLKQQVSDLQQKLSEPVSEEVIKAHPVYKSLELSVSVPTVPTIEQIKSSAEYLALQSTVSDLQVKLNGRSEDSDPTLSKVYQDLLLERNQLNARVNELSAQSMQNSESSLKLRNLQMEKEASDIALNALKSSLVFNSCPLTISTSLLPLTNVVAYSYDTHKAHDVLVHRLHNSFAKAKTPYVIFDLTSDYSYSTVISTEHKELLSQYTAADVLLHPQNQNISFSQFVHKSVYFKNASFNSCAFATLNYALLYERLQALVKSGFTVVFLLGSFLDSTVQLFLKNFSTFGKISLTSYLETRQDLFAFLDIVSFMNLLNTQGDFIFYLFDNVVTPFIVQSEPSMLNPYIKFSQAYSSKHLFINSAEKTKAAENISMFDCER